MVPDRVIDGEQRWHAIGVVGTVHTYPRVEEENLARIIGARKATSHERRRHEAEAP